MIKRNANIRNLDLIGAFRQVSQEIFEAVNGGQYSQGHSELDERRRPMHLGVSFGGTGADTSRGEQQPPGSDLGQEPDSMGPS